jgi:hypothetical protein
VNRLLFIETGNLNDQLWRDRKFHLNDLPLMQTLVHKMPQAFMSRSDHD